MSVLEKIDKKVKYQKNAVFVAFLVGAAGVEPAITPTPRVHVAATPCPDENQFLLERVLIHLVQAKILLPANSLNFLCFIPRGIRAHCKFGYLLILVLGLYFPLSLFSCLNFCEVFPQTRHSFAIIK